LILDVYNLLIGYINIVPKYLWLYIVLLSLTSQEDKYFLALHDIFQPCLIKARLTYS